MKVAGFSIVRNAVKFDYPIVEAITSILPICDKFYLAVGNSDDATIELINSIGSDKIEIINTIWDDSLREGGKVLAVETNKAKRAIPEEFDWAFYIQGDEVIHEDHLEELKSEMLNWKDNKKVEGLVFNYRHFYGSYDFIGDSRSWYRNEVRIIKNDPEIYSFRDAQGFQKHGKPLKVKELKAFVNHYGWVKHPKFQQAKQESFNKLWHSDDWVDKNVDKVDEFDYSEVDALKKFDGTHPKVMQPRINKMNWEFSFDPTVKKLSFKNKVLYKVEQLTGWRIGEYRNFRILK